MTVVPEKNRQGQIILDLSFLVYPGQAKKGADPTQASVNEMTDFLAPDLTVKEIDNVFSCLLQFIELVGTEDIIRLAKIYISC